jgi:hypothetical protein
MATEADGKISFEISGDSAGSGIFKNHVSSPLHSPLLST